MSDLRTRIEQRITDLRVERDIAAAALPEFSLSWGADGDETARHIATQDPASTIARIDRELAGCAADLALLDALDAPFEWTEWQASAAIAPLLARYPSEESA